MNLIKELEDAYFFKFIEDAAQLQFVLQTLKDNLESKKTIYFPNKYYYHVVLKQTWTGLGNSLDYRSCETDAEGMLRGGLIDGLKLVKELFEKRNLTFHFENESFDWKVGNDSYIKHEIEINKKKYVVADGDFDRVNGSLHYLLEVEKIMNEQLLLQGSTERTYKIISSQEEVIWYVMMEDKHFEIFERNKHEFSESQLI